MLYPARFRPCITQAHGAPEDQLIGCRIKYVEAESSFTFKSGKLFATAAFSDGSPYPV
ncbi:hypothetical protein KCP76_17585 [Salmonella enterica subsp. enterica serovar Weltevreden]|nr:hypothetical protein KCP76_17585 [Salmonella enterica subsp. enterica serovar Weltevreden]